MGSKSLCLGDRVFVKPYDCFGKVVSIEHQEELRLADGFAILAGNIYWVELEEKDLKPRGFSDRCLTKVAMLKA